MNSEGFSNELGQAIGFPVPGWKGASPIGREVMSGRYCRLEPLDGDLHAPDLFEAYALDKAGRGWTYLPDGPYTDYEQFREWVSRYAAGDDPMFHAICDPGGGRAGGVASYLRIKPQIGSVEVGYINFSVGLQRTRAATEAMYLMMRRVFDELGYRRYEWKCDSLNAPSRRAAERLGFTFEGVFRQAIIYKGRNRDTAWYSIIDSEWPALRKAFEQWLDPANFDRDGGQQVSLAQLHRG